MGERWDRAVSSCPVPQPGGSTEFAPISADVFARFACENVDCWRQIVGCTVLPAREDWGLGVVSFVSWGSCLEHVPPYIQIVADYQYVGRVRCCAATWSLHHREADIPSDVRQAIDICLSPQFSEDEREDRILIQARQWREARDQEALLRAQRSNGVPQRPLRPPSGR